MAIVYPAGLDSFANPTPGPPGVGSNLANANPALVHSRQHGDANDALEALEVKLGIDGTPAPASVDGRLTAIETGQQITIAALVALRDAADLIVGINYVVTDWTTANSLPGPNYVLARATDVDKLDQFVLVHTPGLLYFGVDIGPTHGIFAWDVLATMIELWDALGNHVYDLGGTGIDDFPWGFPVWSNNTLIAPVFTGGYAVTAAAAAASFVFTGNVMNGGVIDLTGTGTGSSISRCAFLAGTTVTTGGTAQISETTFTGASTLTNSGTSSVSIGFCHFDGTVSVTDTASVSISQAVFSASSLTASNTAQVSLQSSSLLGATVTSDTTGTPALLQIEGSEIVSSQVSMTGADTGRRITDANIWGESVVAITTAAVIGSTFAVRDCEIGGHSTLNVAALGDIARSRIAMDASLSTGNFSHTSVIIDGAFTVTLTAANTNTYRGFGANTLI